jgi:hypothetical protein
MTTNRKLKPDVVLRFISREVWEGYCAHGSPSLAFGVRGPGWYWALVDAHGVTSDEYWWGPEATEDMARYIASQDGLRIVEEV